MKKLVCQSAFLTLVLLLIVAWSGSGGYAVQAAHTPTTSSIQKDHALVVFAELNSDTAGAEGSEQTLNARSVFHIRYTSDLFSVVSWVTHQLYLHRFSQYTHRYLNFRIRLRKANLFFPFHYFW